MGPCQGPRRDHRDEFTSPSIFVRFPQVILFFFAFFCSKSGNFQTSCDQDTSLHLEVEYINIYLFRCNIYIYILYNKKEVRAVQAIKYRKVDTHWESCQLSSPVIRIL